MVILQEIQEVGSVLIALEITGIFTMFIFVFVLIWSFVILNQIFRQLRYKNYLMEKLIQTIYLQGKNGINAESTQTENDEKQEEVAL